jgi:hypothetical protein
MIPSLFITVFLGGHTLTQLLKILSRGVRSLNEISTHFLFAQQTTAIQLNSDLTKIILKALYS